MENFLKPFVGQGVVYSIENISTSADDDSKFNFNRFIRKIIFKHDAVMELKQILNLACSGEPFTVKNDIIKKLIIQLNLLRLSDCSSKEKIEVFHFVFNSFISICKDDNVHVIQFFIILVHILGINAVFNSHNVENCSIINLEHFKNGFEVDKSNPSSVCFAIFKDLLLCLKKSSINLNLLESQQYSKWMKKLIRNISYFQPFQNIFLEIFSISADIDIKLLEGNLDHIFCNILALTPPVHEDFCYLYSTFLETALNTCSKFQRTVKFVTKFLSNIKVCSTLLVKEIILPQNFIVGFSKIVAAASNQQSLALLDVLTQNLDLCFSLILQNKSEFNLLLLLVTSDLLIIFLKDVKLYAPSISHTTLKTLIAKLNIFKEILQKFGTYLFQNMDFMLKNELIVKTFLELCFYCGEIEMLINFYKDSILQPSELVETATEYDWQCCILQEQWRNLINIVIKSELEGVSSVCFQLALQKCRECKLNNKMANIDDLTLKYITSQLTSDFMKFNIFQKLHQEDLLVLIEVLTVKQSKSVCKKIFKQLLENNAKVESTTWFRSPVLQENIFFVLNLFSLILNETGSILRDIIPEKSYLKISWLSVEYFDEHLNICGNLSLQELKEKMNFLLENRKKIRKFVSKNAEQKDFIVRIAEVFQSLPLPYMKEDYRRLGLSFAVKTGVLLADNESFVRPSFESICNFLASDTDASTCFDIGLCIKWLSEFFYENKKLNELRVKIIEMLIRNAPNMKFGLNHLGEMIDSLDTFRHQSPLKMLETRVVLYNELGKCWQRGKKRKSVNDLIGNYRSKLAKIISVEASELEAGSINSENCNIFLKTLVIELNQANKTSDGYDISVLLQQKLLSHFNFAVKNLNRNYDEASALLLTVVLKSMPRIRKFLSEDSFFRIWKALRFCEKINWGLFCSYSTEEEFNEVLDDLLKHSKKFLNSEDEKHSFNCFEIWKSFFEASAESKKNSCQLRLQEFFYYIHDCDILLRDLPVKKKIFLINFFFFCVSEKQVIVTSHIHDTIIHIMLDCFDEPSSMEDFNNLLMAEMETASAILSRECVWSKSKVHLTFLLFKRILAFLMQRCNPGQLSNQDDVIKLSTCAYHMEKWVSIMIKKEKEFARITAYFITALISSIASVTVLPAIKIHLVNCINHFLSISDLHTVSYLMRILKPGYQQVFSSVYNQFKKYHKYSGKI